MECICTSLAQSTPVRPTSVLKMPIRCAEVTFLVLSSKNAVVGPSASSACLSANSNAWRLGLQITGLLWCTMPSSAAASMMDSKQMIFLKQHLRPKSFKHRSACLMSAFVNTYFGNGMLSKMPFSFGSGLRYSSYGRVP